MRLLLMTCCALTISCSAKTNTPNDGPAQVAEAQVSVSAFHTCVNLRGSVHCWGEGTALTVPLSKSARTKGVRGVVELAVSDGHSCARMRDGSVACWGDNYEGQLGAGSTMSKSNDALRVVGLSDATQITVGAMHACAIVQSGGVSCWGANSEGQTGAEAAPARHFVRAQMVPNVADVVQVAAGTWSTHALDRSGQVHIWGKVPHHDKVVAPMPLPGLSDITSIAVGPGYACGVHRDGGVSCWGQNLAGRLGHMERGPAPRRVASVSGVTDIACGGLHACALQTGGNVICWGDDERGQLGRGEYNGPRWDQPPGPVHHLSGVRQLALADVHSCAVTNDDRLWCWGKDPLRQHGSIRVTMPMAIRLF